jgi:hypothetical protein
MTLEEVCREYERLTRLRDSLKAAEADHRPPFYFTQQEADRDKEDRRRAIRDIQSQLYWLRGKYENLGGLGNTEREILLDAELVIKGQEVPRWSERRKTISEADDDPIVRPDRGSRAAAEPIGAQKQKIGRRRQTFP